MINQIAVDEEGEFIATASDDGKVYTVYNVYMHAYVYLHAQHVHVYAGYLSVLFLFVLCRYTCSFFSSSVTTLAM